MFRFFLGCLSLFAIAVVVGQAVAGGNNIPSYNSGVVISETIVSSSSTSPQKDMEPLAGSPGVMVGPVEDSSSAVPVVVEEDVMVETENN